MGLSYGRAGRLTAENGGFRPGQEANCKAAGVKAKCGGQDTTAVQTEAECLDATGSCDKTNR